MLSLTSYNGFNLFIYRLKQQRQKYGLSYVSVSTEVKALNLIFLSGQSREDDNAHVWIAALTGTNLADCEKRLAGVLAGIDIRLAE